MFWAKTHFLLFKWSLWNFWVIFLQFQSHPAAANKSLKPVRSGSKLYFLASRNRGDYLPSVLFTIISHGAMDWPRGSSALSLLSSKVIHVAVFTQEFAWGICFHFRDISAHVTPLSQSLLLGPFSLSDTWTFSQGGGRVLRRQVSVCEGLSSLCLRHWAC